MCRGLRAAWEETITAHSLIRQPYADPALKGPQPSLPEVMRDPEE